MNYSIKKSQCGWICATLGLIISLIFVFMSVNYKVAQDEYAVVENTLTMQFNHDILSQGIYILGPFKRLRKFKRTLQNIELGELTCMTQDEVLVDLFVATQFQYDMDSIIPIILKKFGNDHRYQIFLSSIMKSSILNTCLQFTALDYYEKRAMVDSHMFNNLVHEINNQGLGSTVEYFQLVTIEYPLAYIDVLHKKQNIKQDLITAENNRKTAIIDADTNKLEMERVANINLINAYNKYNITMYNANEQQNAILDQWNNRKATYESIMKSLGLTVPQLVQYIKADIVRTTSSVFSSV